MTSWGSPQVMALAEQVTEKLIEESLAMADGDRRYGHGIGVNRYGRHISGFLEDGRAIAWTLDGGWWENLYASAAEKTAGDLNERKTKIKYFASKFTHSYLLFETVSRNPC